MPDRPQESDPELRRANVSKVFRFQGAPGVGPWDWSHVPIADYKSDSATWKGVTRRVFVGETGESASYHFRYFEVAPRGFTTLESHQHEHTVMVVRGRGQVLIGCETREVGFGDVVYIAPHTPHQFRNDEGAEPFGFTCVVASIRDRPESAEVGFCRICE